MGPASAYNAVLNAIKEDVNSLIKSNPNLFTFENIEKGFVDIRDFQTAGVVAFARGMPFSKVRAGKHSIKGRRIQVKQEYLENCTQAIEHLVNQL